MADITRVCPTCHGVGGLELNPGGPCTCWICSGSGVQLVGQCQEIDTVSEEITLLADRLASPGIFPGYQVLEATVISEYESLSAAHKEAYKMLISPGFVKLIEGSNAWTLLKAMFGPASQTRANLLALIG